MASVSARVYPRRCGGDCAIPVGDASCWAVRRCVEWRPCPRPNQNFFSAQCEPDRRVRVFVLSAS
eukprot:2031412-Rhodomonas_salina.1